MIKKSPSSSSNSLYSPFNKEKLEEYMALHQFRYNPVSPQTKQVVKSYDYISMSCRGLSYSEMHFTPG